MEMADVIVILGLGQSSQLDDECLATDFAASNIERPVEGAIACTIPAAKVHEIERHPAVAYVRRVQGYIGSLAS
jgi:hypothetical protein